VADERAPTPSAAAEVLTPNIDDLRANLRSVNDYMTGIVNDMLVGLRSNITSSQRTLGHVSPVSRIRNLRQRVDDWNARLVSQQRQRIIRLRERVEAREAALRAANPQAIMARGYAIVSSSEDGQRLGAAAGVKAGTGITVQFHDGELKARVEDKDTHEQYKRTLF
jgi:exodeoxyribonuclease VII large subunit